MSTKVKESLFELIKSLSKSEKRYFKLLSSRHTIGDENNYVRLFDYIDKLSEYDEEALFKEFKNEPFINRFSITKKRLYDHILHALDSFHSSASIDSQLYKQMHAADILYSKSLYEQCQRLLRSAEKLAEKHEKFAHLVEIRKKQKKLFENNAYADVTAKDLIEIEEKDAFVVNQITVFNKLWKIKSNLFFQLSRKGKARLPEDFKLYSDILAELPIDFDTKTAPFDAAYLFNHIQSAYWFAIDDLEKSYCFLKANLSTFETREGIIEGNLNSYFSLLTNAIYVSEKLGYSQDSILYLNKLKSIPTKYSLDLNEDLQIKLFASSSSIELSLLMHKGEYVAAEKIIVDIEKGMDLFGNKISPVRKAFIEFKIATIYLGVGNYSNALKWINLVLNDAELDDSEDILSYAQIVDLLIHLEMGHDKLIPYALKSTHRFLKSRNRLHEFEKVFLQFVSKRVKCTNKLDAEILWEELYQNLSGINEEGLQSAALDYFDFKTWAESKFKKKEFTELLKEKFNAKYKKAS